MMMCIFDILIFVVIIYVCVKFLSCINIDFVYQKRQLFFFFLINLFTYIFGNGPLHVISFSFSAPPSLPSPLSSSHLLLLLPHHLLPLNPKTLVVSLTHTKKLERERASPPPLHEFINPHHTPFRFSPHTPPLPLPRSHSSQIHTPLQIPPPPIPIPPSNLIIHFSGSKSFNSKTYHSRCIRR